jgi:hypothetical protein
MENYSKDHEPLSSNIENVEIPSHKKRPLWARQMTEENNV